MHTVDRFRSQCSSLFRNPALDERLKDEHFDVAIVDLFSNGCGLAFASQRKLPMALFWASSFQVSETKTAGDD